MNARGFEGTVLGTLIMPYCSGLGNLIFAFVIGMKAGSGAEVMTNSLVNNVTNLTLLLGLPAIVWKMDLSPKSKSKKKQGPSIDYHINRLSLLLTLTAGLFFTGAVWVLGNDGKLDRSDGMILIGLFLFWQCFHIFEVAKNNVRQNRSFGWKLPYDLAMLGIGAYLIYVSTDWLVDWISSIKSGFVSVKHLGWLTGWLMVLPNGILAIYYARRGNPEVVYTSQVGDGHVSIPLCIGVFCLYRPMPVPEFFYLGAKLLILAGAVHLVFIGAGGRLPRWAGIGLCVAYFIFLCAGFGK
jgi:cation:H+ antiporter